ncbi:DUF4007 family protein [Methylobacterium nodulans]|uniref:DUF4007 domain-containing protein n=1 Tax=Methylobacterium nodulans (strain LMG 21967 / CNCM I-2342 / ORS 2060) TaxID=460265 RepID=B8IDV4_METNO|nr:DUF4007 family protein [Methylobacterium nodulans]ACL55676.1 hypothetical protein Mnod_0642 [Methylobacterium nodulans ORS 2060]
MNQTLKPIRMEFGRHETFTIRHGWLGKGLERLGSPEGFAADTATADKLGLGSRMVRSLAYWLEASGLADVVMEGRSRRLNMSDIGRVIDANDAYVEYPGTLWFLQLAIASRDGSAPAWFFNDYLERSFERAACVEAFLRYAKQRATKTPTLQSTQRDVANVLASYAYNPTEAQDPEDGTICPLIELRLVTYHRDTRRFEKVRPVDPVPIEAVLAAASSCSNGEETLSVMDLASRRHGPGRLFGLSPEMIDRAAQEGARIYAKSGVTYVLLGAERRLSVPNRPPAWWLERHYRRIERQA